MLNGYLPGTTLLHRMPAGAKLLGLLGLSLVVTLPLPEPWRPALPWLLVLISQGALTAFTLLLYGTLGWPGLVRLAGQLRAIRWLIVIVLASQMLFLPLTLAIANSSRMVLVIVLAGLVTCTTTTREILDAVERALAPARRFGVDPARVGLLLSITIRMVPVVASLAHRVGEARAARGARLSVRAWTVPLLVGSLRQGDQLAEALAARGVED